MKNDTPTLRREIHQLEKARDSVEKVRKEASAEIARLRKDKIQLEKDIFRLQDNAKRIQIQIDGLLSHKRTLEAELDTMTEQLRGNQ